MLLLRTLLLPSTKITLVPFLMAILPEAFTPLAEASICKAGELELVRVNPFFCLPKLALPESLGYGNLFRVIIMQFIDAWSFDVRSVKKTCVHIVHPDGRLIPFDTYNLFYRDGLETSRLLPLRLNAELAAGEIK